MTTTVRARVRGGGVGTGWQAGYRPVHEYIDLSDLLASAATIAGPTSPSTASKWPVLGAVVDQVGSDWLGAVAGHADPLVAAGADSVDRGVDSGLVAAVDRDPGAVGGSSRQVAAPIPPEPPVTSATLPATSG
jgi:hypothetical protein